MISIMKLSLKQEDDHGDKEKKGRRVSELQKYKSRQMDWKSIRLLSLICEILFIIDTHDSLAGMEEKQTLTNWFDKRKYT